ncbi:hypothetical protein BDF19DRAFT_450787 [Syncephalis fuscata]|nr:hypothetical protein BDF19DRAFT_450787 [Syncephalis fuscata]
MSISTIMTQLSRKIFYTSAALAALSAQSNDAATLAKETRYIRGVVFDMDGTLTLPKVEFYQPNAT